MRFLVEALQAAREGAGPDMAVGMRFNCDEQIPLGYDSDEASEVVARLCAQGLLDYIDLDVGLEPQQFHHGMPNGFERKLYYKPFVAKVRKAATVPVLSVLGSVTDMALAEAAIAEGVIDVAGAARQLIAEPEFVQNARQGREERSRACIGCNWCTASLGDGAVGCTINPASYRERLWGPGTFALAARKSRVVVVGGGPGGMEAARVAALCGHAVTLYEARPELGGALALWAALPGRAHYGEAIAWWRTELERLGVDVRLGASADEATVLAQNPDAVIVATGARTHPGGRSITHDADIPGCANAQVRSVEDLLLSGERPGGRVFVFDSEGYHGGSGMAEMLAAAGAEVDLVYAGYSPVSPRNTDNWEERYIVGRMKQRGVKLRPTTWLRTIGADSVTLFDIHTGAETVEPADAVVFATGRAPVDDLARALEGKVSQLFTIGDALAARMLAAAPFEGQKFARLIGEPGAPSTAAEVWFAPDDPVMGMLPADILRR